MDVKYIYPFIDATKNVFKDFFKIEPEALTPYLLNRSDNHDWEISAFIGIAGESRGAVALSFTDSLAIYLTEVLTGVKTGDSYDDVNDTIGEVVNIIAGNAKKGLENYRLSISLPSIIRGKNHKVVWPGKNIPIIGISFRTERGDFGLSIGLENIISLD